MAFNMFDSLVAPILLYGSEIWGCHGKHTEIDLIQNGFLKRVLHLPSATDTTILLAETGRLSLKSNIAEGLSRFWKRLHDIQSQDPRRLLSLVFHDHKIMTSQNKPCWGSHSIKLLVTGYNLNGIDIISAPIPRNAINHYENQKIINILHNAINIGVNDHRDLLTHSYMYKHAAHERQRTYARLFWSGGRTTALEMYDSAARQELIRFRLGAHGLQVTAGAWVPGELTARKTRKCKCCSMGIIEDETHIVFECTKYEDIRMKYSQLFSNNIIYNGYKHHTMVINNTDNMMQHFFRENNLYSIARYLRDCRILRSM